MMASFPSRRNTVDCCGAFGAAYDGGQSAGAAHIRALLYFCFGANELNTGNGFGFDGKNFTTSEFVVENGLLEEEMGAEVHYLYTPEMR